MFLAIALYLGAVNLAAFLAFVWDKHCARHGRRRVPEKRLLTLAMAGGTLGAVTGQHGVRHKTCKEPFRTYLQLIAVAQVILVAALSAPIVRDVARSAIQ